MKKVNIVLMSAALICWLFILQSCQIQNNYGKHIIPYKNDSIPTLESKKLLNNLDDHDFLYQSFSTSNNMVIPYRLLTPYHNQSSKKYPLIITLHNSTRIGSDNKNQLEPLARIWLDHNTRKNYQGYVLAPQFSTRSTSYATDVQTKIMTSKPETQLLAIVDLIDSLTKNLNIDENRIYLVGYSMGGSSVINLLNFKPDKFAAAIAIAGVPQFDNSELMSRIPIWLIHGTEDKENPFSGTERFYQDLSQNHKTRYWIFQKRTHDNIVSKSILDKSIPEWLFTKRRAYPDLQKQ